MTLESIRDLIKIEGYQKQHGKSKATTNNFKIVLKMSFQEQMSKMKYQRDK